MLRALRRVILAVLLLLPATLARADGAVPKGYQVTASSALFQGVDHITLTGSDPAESVHVARVAPGAPTALKAVSAYDHIPHRTADQELPSDMCRREACIAGINGDFHDVDTDQPLGGVVTGGRMLRSPRAGYDQFTVARDGTLHAGALGWSGSLTATGGTAITLNGVNVDQGSASVVLYTPAWGGSTPSGAESELVLRAAGPVGNLGVTAVDIVGSRRSSGAIPGDGAVLSATGPGATALADLAARVARGTTPRGAQLQLQTSIEAVESIGVNPVLLRDGKRVYPTVVNGFTSSHNPRTLLGWNPSGEVVLVTVDGRRDDAVGTTLAESADLMLGLGATDAVNFDGGGGTTFVVGGDVKNLPSDPGNPGPPAYPDGHVIAPGHVERLAPNSLVIVPKPADPAPSPAPSDPTTTTTAPAADPGSGSTGGDIPLTTGGGLHPIGGIDGPASVDDPVFVTGGAGLYPRRLMPAPDKERPKGKNGKAPRDGGATGGDLNVAWPPGLTLPGPGDGSGGEQSALPLDGDDTGGPLLDLGMSLAALVASGMILVVLTGISRVRRSRRVRPPLWL